MIVIDNTPHGSKPPAPPLKEDGSLYAFRCHFNSGANIAFTDELEELVNLVIPDYTNLSEEEKDLARLRFLKGQRTMAAAAIVADLKEGEVNEQEYQVLLDNAPSGWGANGLDLWSSEVPLVLVAQDYAPYTQTPRPLSGLGDAAAPANILWLDALNASTFLESLNNLGLITISQTK